MLAIGIFKSVKRILLMEHNQAGKEKRKERDNKRSRDLRTARQRDNKRSRERMLNNCHKHTHTHTHLYLRPIRIAFVS